MSLLLAIEKKVRIVIYKLAILFLGGNKLACITAFRIKQKVEYLTFETPDKAFNHASTSLKITDHIQRQ